MTERANKIVVLLLKIWIVLIFIGFTGISYVNIKVSKQYEDSIYYYKVMNAPVRSFHLLDQDSISRARQERKMGKLLKEIRK